MLDNDQPMQVYSALSYAPLNKRLASFEDKDMLGRMVMKTIQKLDDRDDDMTRIMMIVFICCCIATTFFYDQLALNDVS